MKNMKAGAWIEQMLKSVNKFMRLETTDGARRSGKITGFTYKVIILNEQRVKWPIELEINGDPSDRVSLDTVKTLTID
jgi:hypothetical protein